MIKSRLVAAAVLLAASLVAGQATAQPPAAPAAAPATLVMRQGPIGPIGLLDVNRIFQNHARFKEMKEGMRTDVQNIQQWIKTEQEAIRKMAEGLKDFRTGSVEYKQLDQQITERRTRLQVTIQTQERELMQKEAKILHNVYTEIRQEVESIAAARGLIMVLQFNSKPVNRDEPDDVLRDINSPVVYHMPGIDITDEVLGSLARRMQYGTPATGSTSNRPGIPAPPQR